MRNMLGNLAGLLSLTMLALCSGCVHNFYQNAQVSTRQPQPPPGKALVNFHMPSKMAGAYTVPVFKQNGDFIGLLKKASQFQYACDPGEYVFMGWADTPGSWKGLGGDPVGSIAVLKAELEGDKIYDVLVDISIGWQAPAIIFSPMNKGNERRAKLAEFEQREKEVSSGLQQNEEVAKYREAQQTRVADVKRDFLGGPKSARVHYLRRDDYR